MKEKYRILSLEAVEILYKEGLFENIKENLDLYNNSFDLSLDLFELKNVYFKVYRNKGFSFEDERKNKYTLTVVNVKFSKKTIDEIEYGTLKTLRKTIYENGFVINNVKYVRYKRSGGSSREGNCLFIDEKLLKGMEKWGQCGLKCKDNYDLSSWEAYKALSLSSLDGTIKIPLDSILFINDEVSVFEDEVVSIESLNQKLTTSIKKTKIKNTIWDGQSLLDESLFNMAYENKHMLLLRNKFFKSCAFKTKLQKWLKDNNITTIDQLTNLGHITLAKDVKDIKMVTTPSSLKYLKFFKKPSFTLKNIQQWIENVDDIFGVVKYDKNTRYFDGRMVKSSYQLLNTVQLDQCECEEIIKASKDYLTILRNDIDFMKYHFFNAYAKEKKDYEDDDEEIINDGLHQRAEVIFKLIGINNQFEKTKLYSSFKYKFIEDYKKNLMKGHVLLSGINATLFGNGPEMLLAVVGKYQKGQKSILSLNNIRCEAFEDNEKLVCARSPHITMGNVYCVNNSLTGDIWEYFDLGKNIVCVNAINENLQQRLNGCDYDSDMMLITNEKIIVNKAFLNKDKFKVPVCNIEPKEVTNISLCDLDYKTSENKIGEIVNLSQKLNSIIWEKINNNENDSSIEEIYKDVCKLAVLSGIEIDKAKRSYDVSVSYELKEIKERYEQYNKPIFFKIIDKETKEKYTTQKSKEKTVVYENYQTPMNYIYQAAENIDFRKKRAQKITYVPISSMLIPKERCDNDNIYTYKKKALDVCYEYIKEIEALREKIRKAPKGEKQIYYENLCQKKEEGYKEVGKYLKNKWVVYLTIQELEKKDTTNWLIYAPLLENEIFLEILNDSKEKQNEIYECNDGRYTLFKFKFNKKEVKK